LASGANGLRHALKLIGLPNVFKNMKHLPKMIAFGLQRHHGILLLNSFASFPLALVIIRLWRGPVFWYIHETYDPQIFLRGRDTRKYLEYLQRSKNIQFLFGSDATRRVFAREGFDGRVVYWSGLSLKYPSPSVQGAEGRRKLASKDRRM